LLDLVSPYSSSCVLRATVVDFKPTCQAVNAKEKKKRKRKGAEQNSSPTFGTQPQTTSGSQPEEGTQELRK